MVFQGHGYWLQRQPSFLFWGLRLIDVSEIYQDQIPHDHKFIISRTKMVPSSNFLRENELTRLKRNTTLLLGIEFGYEMNSPSSLFFDLWHLLFIYVHNMIIQAWITHWKLRLKTLENTFWLNSNDFWLKKITTGFHSLGKNNQALKNSFIIVCIPTFTKNRIEKKRWGSFQNDQNKGIKMVGVQK